MRLWFATEMQEARLDPISFFLTLFQFFLKLQYCISKICYCGISLVCPSIHVKMGA